MYFVYILRSQSTSRYYVGQTDNLEQRLKRHNSNLVRATKGFAPWELVHFEEYETRSEAMKREKEIKNKKSRKYIEKLIAEKPE